MNSETSVDLLPPRLGWNQRTAEELNQNCFCRSLDFDRLRSQLAAGDDQAQALDRWLHDRPHLFASTVVFLSEETAQQIAACVAAIEHVVHLPAYQQQALARSPEIARIDWGPRGVCMGFDFHLDASGPKLIEVNTNAGGLMLNLQLARAQRACCEELDWALSGREPSLEQVEQDVFEMFLDEWCLQGRSGQPKLVGIVDERPSEQYLAPEFVAFQRFFEQRGLRASVIDVAALTSTDGRLSAEGRPVDLVYNRLTDFYFEAPESQALRAAYLAGSAVVTPHPRAHALYADKRNLAVLSDDAVLARWGVEAPWRQTLQRAVPRTELVTPERAEELWARRRTLFFKPAGGYGAKAAYRGDKLTRRVWEEILRGDYVAQALVAPAARFVEVDGVRADLKFDVRAYAYAGRVQLLAARIYAGQTTNFRTAGGGFAPVVVLPAPEMGRGLGTAPGM
jgi:hypothetical protein